MWEKLDYIVAVSTECRESFLERYPQLSDKVIVIENILSSQFIRAQALEFDIAHDMPTMQNVINILSVGRYSHAKGFDQAILACRKLVDNGYNIRWYVIGYGPDEFMIRKLILENRLADHFILLGKKMNPYPYMKACDIFVLPSRYEGKSVTVREAQILGKPVIITRFTTAKSQVEDGVDGKICELSVDGIVVGISQFIDDLACRNRVAATAASRDYDNKDEVKKIYSLIP